MYERIVVPLDGSAFSEGAIAYAALIAARSGATIELVHVHVPEPEDDALYSFTAYRYTGVVQWYRQVDRAAMRREVEAYRARAADLASETGLPVIARVVSGHIDRGIEEEAETFHADLIVMGTHARTGFARVRFGSVAETVVRMSTVPVLLVRPDAETSASLSPPDISRVLVALDGSAFSEQVLPPAARLAAVFDAALGVVHVETGLREAPSSFDELSAADARVGEQYLHGHVAKSEHLPDGARLLLVGSPHPADAIMDAASRLGSDLIAMATHGRGGLSRLIMGSTANEVMRRTRLPVLLHRPDARVVRATVAAHTERIHA